MMSLLLNVLFIPVGMIVFLMILFILHIIIDGNPRHYPLTWKGFVRWAKAAVQMQ